LNQPVWGDEGSVSFTRELLESARTKSLIDVLRTPSGEIVGAIDLARENKQFSDYTALVVGRIYQEAAEPLSPEQLADPFFTRPDGKIILVIIDVQFGKWSQTEIAARIAAMNDKWRPKRWFGEDTGGLQLLKEKIIDTSKVTYGHWPIINWRTPDNSESAKRNRIKGLEILLRSKRMYFCVAPWNEEVFAEFEKYRGQKSSRYSKDDVPDATSFLTYAMPQVVPMSKRELEQRAAEREAEYRETLRRQMYDHIFGNNSGGFGAGQQWSPSPYNEPTQQDRGSGIGNKFFRGNGMRA
jgi:hypothetical protein